MNSHVPVRHDPMRTACAEKSFFTQLVPLICCATILWRHPLDVHEETTQNHNGVVSQKFEPIGMMLIDIDGAKAQ